MNDILSVILIIVFGLIVSFLVFSLTFSVLYSFSDSDFFEHFFELSAKICLVGALILLAVEMLLFAGIGVASFDYRSKYSFVSDFDFVGCLYVCDSVR